MHKIEIIAEIGSVHDGSFGNALKLIDLSSELGVDVVKFQTHIAEEETIKNAPSPSYFKGEERYSYFRRTAFSKEQWRELKKHANQLGLKFMSSPFSEKAVEFLEETGVDIYKIASGEVTNLPMLNSIAQTGKRVIISSGMSNWTELDEAIETLKASCEDLMVMQCSSKYPCPPEKVGLNILAEMKKKYNLPVGFSDHSDGIAACLAACSLGATSIEKHLTFSKKMYGSDAGNATEPEEFDYMVKSVRDIEKMLSNPVDKDNISEYEDMKNIFEKSLVLIRPLKKGEIITADNIGIKKPGNGIPAKEKDMLVGKKTKIDMAADHLIKYEDVT